MRVSPASYSITDEGVILRIQHSTGPRRVVMTEGEAKRLAWAILNDLDPEAVYDEQKIEMGWKRASRAQWRVNKKGDMEHMKPKNYRPTEADYDEYRRLRESGLSLQKIAKQVGLSASKLRRAYIARFGTF